MLKLQVTVPNRNDKSQQIGLKKINGLKNLNFQKLDQNRLWRQKRNLTKPG